MGDISCSNGISNGNGVNGKSHSSLNGYRKSCWYEEEIEENLRWCFALNRYIYKLHANCSVIIIIIIQINQLKWFSFIANQLRFSSYFLTGFFEIRLYFLNYLYIFFTSPPSFDLNSRVLHLKVKLNFPLYKNKYFCIETPTLHSGPR